MENKYSEIGIICGVAVSALGALTAFIISLVNRGKVSKAAALLNRTSKELLDKDFQTNITQDFIEKVATDKIEREMDRRARDVKCEAIAQMGKTFRDVIQQEVNNQYDDTRAMVKQALTERVGEIDISDVKREVISTARYNAERKFTQALDEEIKDIGSKYGRNLDNFNTLYESMMTKIVNKPLA